jgi:hypothetical protein
MNVLNRYRFQLLDPTLDLDLNQNYQLMREFYSIRSLCCERGLLLLERDRALRILSYFSEEGWIFFGRSRVYDRHVVHSFIMSAFFQNFQTP